MAPAPDSRPNVTRSLHRAVGLLRLLASHTRIGWRLSDLADHTGLDPATVHRLLRGLVDEGLATRVPDSRHYTLGPLAFELGLAAAPYFDLGRLTHSRLAAAAQTLRGTIFLKMRSGVESVCLARHDGVGPLASLMLDVGGRRPLCLTAGGVAMLIHLPMAEQQQIEGDNRRRIARDGSARWPRIQTMLDRSRSYGFALNLGDLASGITAIGVPLLAGDHAPVASLTLAVTGPVLTERLAVDIVQQLRPEVQAMSPLLDQLRIGAK